MDDAEIDAIEKVIVVNKVIMDALDSRGVSKDDIEKVFDQARRKKRRRDTQESFTVTNLFELLRSSEVLRELIEKLEVQLSDEAVVKYLTACEQALDAADEDEKRILKDAIFVLESNWKPSQRILDKLNDG